MHTVELTRSLEEVFAAAIALAFPGEPTDPVLRPTDRGGADFQVNAALALSKRVKSPPPKVAAAILEKLAPNELVESVEIAGPGFINVKVKTAAIDRALRALAEDPRAGVGAAASPETIVIDYSAPNVAKELHVGHIRSTVIGDALARLLEARGHRVIRQNHLGDWGTPFGMLIEHLVDLGQAEADAPLTIEDLDGFYKAARAKFDGDAVFAERARTRVVALQGGDALSLTLWKKLCAESRRYFQAVYDKLDITLKDADVAGESFYGPELPEIVKTLEAQGLAKEDADALCVFPPGFKNKEGNPLPLIIQKNDGGFGYATTDLAAIRYRFGKLGADRAIYVVGSPQAQHLSMIFETAKLAGWLAPPKRAIHVAFGSILGPDKKMFKTRTGETVKLASLVDEAIERGKKVVDEKSPELPEREREKIGEVVGVGAIKYADLSSDRIKDYVFDWERMLATEGNTGPYMMYAHARCRSIARKNQEAGRTLERGAFAVGEPAERALALRLLGFSAAVRAVDETLQPHGLCTYLYELASAYSTFYNTCPVLKAETETLRDGRLRLCELTATTLATGLALLGIGSPERM